MSLRSIAVLLVLVVALVSYLAWSRNTQRATPPMAAPSSGEVAEPPAAGSGAQDATPAPMPSPGGEASDDPGLAWSVPSHWTNRGPGSMRLATYTVPGGGGADEAQCAVYYFGPSGGGGVDPNIERWRGEFKDTAEEKRGTLDTPGGKVTTMSLRGTYLAHAGMMGGGSDVDSPHWGLLGAIVQGPRGEVYFKLTGPEKTVQSAEHDFDAMLRSIGPK